MHVPAVNESCAHPPNQDALSLSALQGMIRENVLKSMPSGLMIVGKRGLVLLVQDITNLRPVHNREKAARQETRLAAAQRILVGHGGYLTLTAASAWARRFACPCRKPVPAGWMVDASGGC